MDELKALEQRVRQQIPVTHHLGFTLDHHDSGEMTMRAPLAMNSNDKGTFFAGSQAALLALAGWALTTLEAEQVTAPVDVLAAESSLKHREPAAFDVRLTARADPEALERFRGRLAERGRASLTVTVELAGPDGELATTYEGVYVARSKEATS